MKKWIAGFAVAASLVLSVGVVATVDAKADDVTVTGTVQDGSTFDVIKVKTSDGEMQLKVDGNSDLSKCKNMMPGRNVVVDITYGNDGYWHIKSVKEGTNASTATVDKANLSTVSGTPVKIDANNVMYFDTQYGQMQIKLDPTTDYSKCTVLLPGNNYTLQVAYGSDAYMHAVTVADGASRVSYSSSSSSSSTANVKAEATVTGKVLKKSTDNLLYLDTPQGEMQIKLDQYNGPIRILVQDQTITVGINYGNEYWHAVSIS